MKKLLTRGGRRTFGSVAVIALAIAGALLIGCAANDPFDPDSSPNARPTVRLFAQPLESGGELAPTSYNARTFYWSGSDRDGWVVEYHVSIRTDRDVPAPWTVTTRTDTSMSFETDDNGEAEATFYLVCRDNRGALSDTVTQLVPLRNFPPVINFEPDFNPYYDLQQEISSENDTTYWNWGVNSFRMFAYDPDGNSTMDSFCRYTLSDEEPTVTVDEGEAGADPETVWVRRSLGVDDAGSFHLEFFFTDIQPGTRTLTLSLADEAEVDTRFTYTWEVRSPKGAEGSRVLFVQEGAQVAGVFAMALDQTYGEGGWDVYRFWAQFPDKPIALVETFRKFDLVIWGNSGSASPNLKEATDKKPALNNSSILGRYVDIDNPYGGRLLMYSPQLVGYSSTIEYAFLINVLGLTAVGTGVVPVTIPAGKLLLGDQPHLGSMIAQSVYPKLSAVQLVSNGTACEPIYRMEACTGCYGDRTSPPSPVLGMRRPLRSASPYARVVSMGLTPEQFFNVDNATTYTAIDALSGLMTVEMGVSPE